MESTGCLQSSLGRAQSLGGLVTKSSRKSKRSVVSVCGGGASRSSSVHGFSASEQWGVAVAATTNTKSVVTTRRKSSAPLKVCLGAQPATCIVMSTCKFDSGVNCILGGRRFCFRTTWSSEGLARPATLLTQKFDSGVKFGG